MTVYTDGTTVSATSHVAEVSVLTAQARAGISGSTSLGIVESLPSHFFRDNLISYLPLEFEVQDMANGDLDAFLKIAAIPLDEVKTFIDDFSSIFNLDPPEQGGADPSYYPYLAHMLNYPLSDRDEYEDQRLQLVNAVEVYKQKGLEESFKILFYSLGYVINLVPLWTRDYENFAQYPGTFTPTLFNATLRGYPVSLVPITGINRYLLVAIDGGSPQLVTLNLGESSLSSIASQIDAVLEPAGKCFLDTGYITISSNSVGQGSSVNVLNVVSSAYRDLGFSTGIRYGIDATVPEDYSELLGSGGDWYPSPHFGIQVYSIKGYVTDPTEFAYIRSRIELIRPCHTVLEWIDYVKNLSDIFETSEGDLFGQIEFQFQDTPWPLCPDRGATYEYIRDGTVHDRSDTNRLFYQHFRNTKTTAHLRDYEYQTFNLSRQYSSGPPQMRDRGATATATGGGPYYFRGGYYLGDPTRKGCQYNVDPLSIFSFPSGDPSSFTPLELNGLGPDGTGT